MLILLASEEKIYTYEEYLKISDEDRCEFIDGKIYMMGSPSNSSHDYVTKLDLYLRAGVCEYWILNPINKNAICYRFENKMPSKVEGYHYDEVIKSEIFEGLNIPLKELFE